MGSNEATGRETWHRFHAPFLHEMPKLRIVHKIRDCQIGDELNAIELLNFILKDEVLDLDHFTAKS